jgi:serine/threonine protein kinase
MHEHTERFGSLNYTAPEAIGGAEVDTNDLGHTVKNVFIDLKAKKDLWSIGVLTYALLSGNLPFQGANETAT